MNERRNVPEIVIATYELLRRSQTRIDLLFTMSNIPQAHPVKDNACEVMFSRTIYSRLRSSIPSGGARRDRTDDLMLAKHALSQLSYGPVPEDECICRARLRQRYGAAAFVQEGLPSQSCRAAKAGGPGKT
jgi:hypothetical protein